MTRKKLSPQAEAEVLVSSRRRCCICFGLDRDIGVKRGQIAHLDRDSSNDSLENLAFFCFEHHDEYDSNTSQSKGFTLPEVKRYRDELHRSVIPLLEKPTFLAVPPRDVGQQKDIPCYEVQRSKEQKTALLELMPQRGAVHSFMILSQRLGLSTHSIEKLLFELAEEGAVRIDRETGTLKKAYSLAASEENRLIDTFIASLGEDVLSDYRHIRLREVELDAIVKTSSATYVLETLIMRDQIVEADIRRRISKIITVKHKLKLDSSTSVLLIGIADTTVRADANLKQLEAEEVLVKYVELTTA